MADRVRPITERHRPLTPSASSRPANLLSSALSLALFLPLPPGRRPALSEEPRQDEATQLETVDRAARQREVADYSLASHAAGRHNHRRSLLSVVRPFSRKGSTH